MALGGGNVGKAITYSNPANALATPVCCAHQSLTTIIYQRMVMLKK
jgi:hypothetical protein